VATYRLDLSYDGSGFRGMARQSGVRTVQGELERVLNQVIGEPILTVVAGRTDAGVHARLQVVSFSTDLPVDGAALARSINRMLGGEVVAGFVGRVADGFSARFSAVSRTYHYQVLEAPVPDPLRRHLVWHVGASLELESMNRAAAGFVGIHDFAAFCRQAEGRSTERQVLSAGWDRQDDLVVFEITATAFCHQMVRSLVGFCVDAGRGRVSPEAVGRILAGRDRNAGRPMAPAAGLILWDVAY
jgi:tRNA pseudouridine38-40 synthase